ncbi:MAG: hypothetical protein ACI97A_001306 [Planctomycetota bacterium]|jgi:hypothetical protein
MSKSVLFHRELLDFSGGHLKVHDYFRHVFSDSNFTPTIYFTPNSIWTERNPWHQLKSESSPALAADFDVNSADILLLAGNDWLALSEAQRQQPPCPVINLIQHVRHADPKDPRYPFLVYPATRIAVSQEVADAVRATGKANGDVLAIPNGLDFSGFPEPLRTNDRPQDVMVVGIKQLKLAQKLTRKIRKTGCDVDLLDRNVPRAEFLRRLSEAKMAIFLPDPTEGFYLPPLEAMVLNTFVICPDCEGNRVFCHANRNCLQPKLGARELFDAFKTARDMSDSQRQAIVQAGHATSLLHDIKSERAAFLEILCGLV